MDEQQLSTSAKSDTEPGASSSPPAASNVQTLSELRQLMSELGMEADERPIRPPASPQRLGLVLDSVNRTARRETSIASFRHHADLWLLLGELAPRPLIADAVLMQALHAAGMVGSVSLTGMICRMNGLLCGLGLEVRRVKATGYELVASAGDDRASDRPADDADQRR